MVVYVICRTCSDFCILEMGWGEFYFYSKVKLKGNSYTFNQGISLFKGSPHYRLFYNICTTTAFYRSYKQEINFWPLKLNYCVKRLFTAIAWVTESCMYNCWGNAWWHLKHVSTTRLLPFWFSADIVCIFNKLSNICVGLVLLFINVPFLCHLISLKELSVV